MYCRHIKHLYCALNIYDHVSYPGTAVNDSLSSGMLTTDHVGDSFITHKGQHHESKLLAFLVLFLSVKNNVIGLMCRVC